MSPPSRAPVSFILNNQNLQKTSPLALLAATCKKIGRPTSPLLDKRPPKKFQSFNVINNSPPISPNNLSHYPEPINYNTPPSPKLKHPLKEPPHPEIRYVMSPGSPPRQLERENPPGSLHPSGQLQMPSPNDRDLAHSPWMLQPTMANTKPISCSACSAGMCCDQRRRVPSVPPTLTPPPSPYPQRPFYAVPPPSVINSQMQQMPSPGLMTLADQKPTMSQPTQIFRPHIFSRRMISPLRMAYGSQPYGVRPPPAIVATHVNTTVTRTRRRCECPNCVSGTQNLNSKPKQHVCHIPGCGKVYGKTSHLRAHLRWHAGLRPFICNWLHCGKSFTRSDELQRHLKTHTGEKRFACTECEKRFLRSDHLSKHMKTHQNKTNKALAEDEDEHSELEDEESIIDVEIVNVEN